MHLYNVKQVDLTVVEEKIDAVFEKQPACIVH